MQIAARFERKFQWDRFLSLGRNIGVEEGGGNAKIGFMGSGFTGQGLEKRRDSEMGRLDLETWVLIVIQGRMEQWIDRRARLRGRLGGASTSNLVSHKCSQF